MMQDARRRRPRRRRDLALARRLSRARRSTSIGIGIVGAPLAALLALWLTPVAARASWRMAAAIGLAMGIGAAYLGVVEVALLTPDRAAASASTRRPASGTT